MKYITILFALLGLYWTISSLTQQGIPLLIIPGILCLFMSISLNISEFNRFSNKLLFPLLLYNLVLTFYQSYASLTVLSSRFITLEIGIFVLNFVFTLLLTYVLLQSFRKSNRIDIS